MIEIRIGATIKRTITECCVSAGVAIALLGVAKELVVTGIWHDTLLLVSGVLLGAFCFYFTLLDRLVKAKRAGARGDTTARGEQDK